MLLVTRRSFCVPFVGHILMPHLVFEIPSRFWVLQTPWLRIVATAGTPKPLIKKQIK